MLAKYWIGISWIIMLIGVFGNSRDIIEMIGTLDSKNHFHECSRLGDVRRNYPNLSDYTNKDIYEVVAKTTKTDLRLEQRLLIYQAMWKEDKKFCP